VKDEEKDKTRHRKGKVGQKIKEKITRKTTHSTQGQKDIEIGGLVYGTESKIVILRRSMKGPIRGDSRSKGRTS
jgi:hypothetical protein